ncbi:MAG: PHP domain-containing protein [Bacillota bacterium]|nr:PHP domain-containing protein [Bacillota bacterium]
MKFATDLHIHSALSPCADKDMTPNNIVNMARLKALDIIAVTDHNSAENIEAVLSCCEGSDVLTIPGMEIETREEVHLICLFPDLESVLAMQKKVYDALPGFKNNEKIFGEQIIFNSSDEITGSVDQLLLTATRLSLEETVLNVLELGGAVIPAHIDRNSYSILSNLGGIPENLNIRWLEVSRGGDREKLLKEVDYLSKYFLLTSSDAHSLENILERENFIELSNKTVESLLCTLRNGY